MDRAIEDVGTLTPLGEKYYIGNPGYGITADPATWDAGYPLTPKAKRDYDAVEFRVDKRFSRSYYFSASLYLEPAVRQLLGWLVDELGSNGMRAQDPSVSRYFDLPYWSFYDSHGTTRLRAPGHRSSAHPQVLRRLHAGRAKFRRNELRAELPDLQRYPNIPRKSFVISSVPVYVKDRGDLGRTPVFSQTDFYVYHEVQAGRSMKPIASGSKRNVSNLFNQSTVTGKYSNYLNRQRRQLPPIRQRTSTSSRASTGAKWWPTRSSARIRATTRPTHGRVRAISAWA